MNTEILFFSAPWCGPCKMMKSALSEDLMSELNIRVIDIAADMELATEYQVMNVPTFVKLVDNQEVSRKVGTTTIEKLRNL
jgi:thioredoxin 1